MKAQSSGCQDLRGKSWGVSLSDVSVVEKLGSGTRSDVYRGLICDRNVAVKRLEIGNMERIQACKLEQMQQDIEVTMRISHRNLVSMLGATFEHRSFQIISDFCAGGCLFELLHNCEHIELGWPQQLRMATDVAMGMDYLHNFDPNIMHRALTSLNLLLDQPVLAEFDVPHVKVSDFGGSRMDDYFDFDWGRRRCHWCSTYHIAPEIYHGSPYTDKSDIYAYSMILFEIICREIPFEEEEPLCVGSLTMRGSRPDLDAVPPDCPPHFRDLMLTCWAPDPEQRPTFEFCVRILDPMLESVVVTLHLQADGSMLSCVSPGGDELLALEIGDAKEQTVGEIRRKVGLIRLMGQCTGQPKLLLPSGQLVNFDCDDKTLAEILC